MAELRMERSIEVEATPEQIWEFMVDIGSWSEWKPFLISAAPVSGSPLTLGSKLKFKPRMGPLPITLKVEIIESNPPHRFAWTGGGPGLKAVHSFDFKDAGAGKTQVISWEEFKGIGVNLLKLFVSEEDLGILHDDWVRAIKEKAEKK